MDSGDDLNVGEDVLGNANVVPLLEKFIFISSSSERYNKKRIIHILMF